MRAPAFWAAERGGLAAAALTPFSWLYRFGARSREALVQPAGAGLPVICVGNFTVGGAGKTPTVLALVALLAEEGIRPHILTRGYGGRERGPLRVDPARHDARAVGDEALLLARAAPTWLSRDRAAGADAAQSAGAEMLLMDDGMQSPGLAKDLCLAVVDGGAGIGNGCVLPAGPLREPLAIALKLLAQPSVLRRDAPQLLCEHAVVGALVGLLTQPSLARLERDLNCLVARERLSRRPDRDLAGDPLDQCVPGELGACVPTVEYLDDRVHLRRG